MRASTLKFAMAFVFAVLSVAAVWAQSPPAEQGPVLTLKAGADMVQIDVSLRPRKGLDLSKVPASGWVVLEDDKPQEVKSVSKEELPLAIALVLDVSDSMQATFDHLKYSARTALDALHSNDRLVLFAFTTRVARLTELTSDREQVTSWFEKLQARGGTDISDALWEASDYLKIAAPHDRRAIVLISDNIQDRRLRPNHGVRGLENLLLENQTDLVSIRIYDKYRGWIAPEAFTMPQVARRYAGSPVGDLISETDGSIFFSDAEDIGRYLNVALTELRSRYTLGYYASHAGHEPGSFHHVKVKLAPELGKQGKDYWLRARPGYFTPKAQTSAAATSPEPAPAR